MADELKTSGFREPGLSPPLLKALGRGLRTPSPIQAQTIPLLLSGLERPGSNAQVVQRHVEQTKAAAIREIVDIKDALTWYLGALGELRAAIDAQRVAASGPPGGIYANALFSQARGEAILFVPRDGAIRSIGRVRPYLVAPAELATLVHEGSHEDVDLTYGALASHVTRHAIAVDGPLREYYLSDRARAELTAA